MVINFKAVNNGTGSFAVCAGDYGWHLVYVTYTFDVADTTEHNGEVYSPDWTKIGTEGTFEDLFYEWIKNNDIKNAICPDDETGKNSVSPCTRPRITACQIFITLISGNFPQRFNNLCGYNSRL